MTVLVDGRWGGRSWTNYTTGKRAWSSFLILILWCHVLLTKDLIHVRVYTLDPRLVLPFRLAWLEADCTRLVADLPFINGELKAGGNSICLCLTGALL
jgi:hypothetical protein